MTHNYSNEGEDFMLEKKKGFLKRVSRETGKTGKLTEKLDKT